VKRNIYLHEKKIYFHENNSKGEAFNGKGGHKLGSSEIWSDKLKVLYNRHTE